MDVLKPPIIHIGGRCYRRNPTAPPPGWKHGAEEQGYQEDEEILTSVDNEALECSLDFQETSKGFSLSIDVPSTFFGVIIGKGGEKKRRIEQETQCQIEIPRQRDRSDMIVIRGTQKSKLISAKTRIDVLVDSARQRQRFTHFLSFPLNAPKLKGSFKDFKEDVLRQCDGAPGVDENVFQNPDKLHLTIATLVLLTKTEVMKAQELLEKCKVEVIEPLLQGEPCKVDVKGLEYMNDDPSRVRVLYAKVEPQDNSNKLQVIADTLMERFQSSGLGKVEYDRVKLHATLMNCIYRRGTGDGVTSHDDGTTPQANEDFFDAQPILQKFGDYSFGSHTIDTVHISQRGSYDPSGFYLSAGQIQFPDGRS